MSEPKDDGGSAFPMQSLTLGMSLRDWFAGQALVGLLASSPTSNEDDSAAEANATWAYEFADAMLAERRQ